MKTILDWLLGNIWPAVGAVAAILLLSGALYVEHTRLSAADARLGAAEAARDQWKANFATADATAKENASTLDTYKAMVAAGEAKADAERAARAALQTDYDALKGKIRNAPPTDDGPVAAVLRSAMDGLR